MKIIKLDKKDETLKEEAKINALKYNPFCFIRDDEVEVTYLIFDDENIIGGVDYSVVLDSADILFIYINKEYQNKGFGKMLLNSSVLELSKVGVESVFLEVDSTNEFALKLYKSCGFIKFNTRNCYYSNGHDAIMMKKTLEVE